MELPPLEEIINFPTSEPKLQMQEISSIVKEGLDWYDEGDYVLAEQRLQEALTQYISQWELQNRPDKLLRQMAFVSKKLSNVKLNLGKRKEAYLMINLSIWAYENIMGIEENEKITSLAFLYKRLGETTLDRREAEQSFLKSYRYFKQIPDLYENETKLRIFAYLCRNLSITHNEPQDQIKFLKEEIDAIERLKRESYFKPDHEGYARIMLGRVLIRIHRSDKNHSNEIKENYETGIQLLEKSLKEYPPEIENYWKIRKWIVISSRIFATYLYSINEENSNYLEKAIKYGYNSTLLEDEEVAKAVLQASYFLWKKTKNKEYKKINEEVEKIIQQK